VSSRLRSRVVWSGDPSSEQVGFDFPMAPRDAATALLFLGAEIEHALMLQYLYAAYSLNESQPDPHRRNLVNRWKSAILEIAREEMGHLVTVQNLLTAIGGPLYFERDDYPIHDDRFWPFPFQLEPLTKASLAKYVLAEMPADEIVAKLRLQDKIEEIKARVHGAEDPIVHRVGALYDAIAQIFTLSPIIQGPPVPGITDAHPFVATVDIQASSLKYQVHFGAWGLGLKDVLIEVAGDRDSALRAIQLIAVQGEGKEIDADLRRSHFGRFLQIYEEFPEPGDWPPSVHAVVNPTTNLRVTDLSRRLEGEARDWAILLNLRYRMLLTYLKHSFYIEAPVDGLSRSPRGSLVSWAFGEMYHIRSVADILMTLPARPGANTKAGPPFEMPYSLALPARNADRWRVHRDLLLASMDAVGALSPSSGMHASYLKAMRTADQTALEQITALIGA
jgi:hypothetical protein